MTAAVTRPAVLRRYERLPAVALGVAVMSAAASFAAVGLWWWGLRRGVGAYQNLLSDSVVGVLFPLTGVVLVRRVPRSVAVRPGLRGDPGVHRGGRRTLPAAGYRGGGQPNDRVWRPDRSGGRRLFRGGRPGQRAGGRAGTDRGSGRGAAGRGCAAAGAAPGRPAAVRGSQRPVRGGGQGQGGCGGGALA